MLPLVPLAIAGSILNSYGAYASAKNEKSAFNYNAQVYGQQAADALQRGREAEYRYRENVSRVTGSQRAALAANGVDLGQGSALDILAETDALGSRDAALIRLNAEREAYGYQTRQAQARFAARSINPLAAGFTSFVNGAGNVATAWKLTH